jgi:hypothetical protein
LTTYILKYTVSNEDYFIAGTVVTITDDYYSDKEDNPNTGFTVAEGELKGKKGHVADGLQGWLLENTEENRKEFNAIQDESRRLQGLIDALYQRWHEIPNALLPVALPENEE